jgi:hypothetical protein
MLYAPYLMIQGIRTWANSTAIARQSADRIRSTRGPGQRSSQNTIATGDVCHPWALPRAPVESSPQVQSVPSLRMAAMVSFGQRPVVPVVTATDVQVDPVPRVVGRLGFGVNPELAPRPFGSGPQQVSAPVVVIAQPMCPTEMLEENVPASCVGVVTGDGFPPSPICPYVSAPQHHKVPPARVPHVD